MKRPELQIVSGALAGTRYEVKEGGVRLGRSSSNDIAIPDEELSRNHCLFEPVGETGVRVTDLASANGTSVNGVPLGGDPVDLKVGDRLVAGETVICVVGDLAPVTGDAVDLGLGGETPKDAAAPARRRSPLANALWGVAVLLSLTTIVFMLTAPSEPEPAPKPAAVEVPTVCEVLYEKVEATLEGIYRCEITVSRDGCLRVRLDDTKENRHPTIQPKPLGEEAKAELNDILAFDRLREIEREYVGPDPEPQALNSWRLKVVYSTRVRSVRIVNAQEPESFRAIREKFEAFANNELGIRAIQYSREKLVALSQEQIEIGKARWDDRDVQHGNLFASVSAYREAIFYLDTLDPKPDCVQAARQGLEQAKAELDRRYGDQRFVVDRAINLGDWEAAKRELAVLLEMIPDRKDDRNREASAKLLDVEKRMRGGQK